jgi:hypothetical protein
VAGNGFTLFLRLSQSGLHPRGTLHDHLEHDFVGWQIAIAAQGKIIAQTLFPPDILKSYE